MGRDDRKDEQGKSRQVNASRKVNHREKGHSELDRQSNAPTIPQQNQSVTSRYDGTMNGLQYTTKRGKAHKFKETQFQPGQSGNPAGRPRSADLKAAVREFADEVDPKRKKSRLRAWMETADRMARQGSSKHLELLLAYGWHRPLQQQLNVTADLASDEETNREIREALAAIRDERGNLPIN